jgi:hypothetical protein
MRRHECSTHFEICPEKGTSMQAISDNLIHFLDKQHKASPNEQFGVFKSIIKLGLRLTKNSITFGGSGSLHNYIVCFTDIPLNFCDEHTTVYGKFGIGFKKSSIKKCGGNPVRYFIDRPRLPGDYGGAMYDNLCSHFGRMQQLSVALDRDDALVLYDRNGEVILSNDALKEWRIVQRTVLSFEKEMDSGPVSDETNQTDLYYKEREWRLVPLIGNKSSGFVVHEMSEDCYYYKFDRSDVNMVVTPNDELRTEVLRFLLGLVEEQDDRLSEFARNPLPIITYDDLHKW